MEQKETETSREQEETAGGKLAERLRTYKSWLTPEKLVLGGLVGALLLVLSMPVTEQEEPDGTKEAVEAADEEACTDTGYCEKLEARLKAVLDQVEGVGQTTVMITLESSSEAVVNKDAPIQRETAEQTQGEDTKHTYQYAYEEETVLSSVDGDQVPYVIKSIYPKIQGVVIVAQGAQAVGVKNEIIEAVEVLFGIEPHKVKVLGMES